MGGEELGHTFEMSDFILFKTYFLIVLDLVVQNGSIREIRLLPRESNAVLGSPVLPDHTYQGWR